MNLSDKHKALAIECGVILGAGFNFLEDHLALYTSKIQAEERERCAALIDVMSVDQHGYISETVAEEIRSLK